MTMPTPGFDPPPRPPLDPLPESFSVSTPTTDNGAAPAAGPSSPPSGPTPTTDTPPSPTSDPSPHSTDPPPAPPLHDATTDDHAATDGPAWDDLGAPARAPIPASSREHPVARQMAEAAFRAVGAQLHARLTPDAMFGPNEVWLPDDEDIAGVAGPLARIASRRLPTTGGPLGDLGDAIEAGAAMTNYALRNAQVTRQWHRAAAEQMAAQPPPPAP